MIQAPLSFSFNCVESAREIKLIIPNHTLGQDGFSFCPWVLSSFCVDELYLNHLRASIITTLTDTHYTMILGETSKFPTIEGQTLAGKH